MKKDLLLPLLMAFIMALGCVSCSDDDDNSTQIQITDNWENNCGDYAINTYNGLTYIEMPANGGTLTLLYSLPDSLSIDSLYMDNNIESDPNFIPANPKYYRDGNKICSQGKTVYEVTINKQNVKVEFQPNNDFTRRGIINFNVGNKKIQFRFWQKPVGQLESIRKKLIGDWIESGEKYRKENKRFITLSRISFHDDGTFFSSSNFVVGLPSSSYGLSKLGDEGHFGLWKDSCNVLIMRYGDGYSSWGCEEWRNFKVSDEHINIDNESFVFDRVENTKEPVAPFYTLNIKRREENLPYNPKQGETYMLEGKLYAKGNNFTFDKVCLVRNTITGFKNDDYGYKYNKETTDTIDISQYAKNNYEFSIPMQYTGRESLISYIFIYEGTFTSPYYEDLTFNNNAGKSYIFAPED